MNARLRGVRNFCGLMGVPRAPNFLSSVLGSHTRRTLEGSHLECQITGMRAARRWGARLQAGASVTHV